MSLQKLRNPDISQADIKSLLSSLVIQARSISESIQVFILGSAARSEMTAESDLDVAIIIPDDLSEKFFHEKMRESRIFGQWPIDLILIKKSRFDQRKDVGGISFDVQASGIELYPEWKWL